MSRWADQRRWERERISGGGVSAGVVTGPWPLSITGGGGGGRQMGNSRWGPHTITEPHKGGHYATRLASVRLLVSWLADRVHHNDQAGRQAGTGAVRSAAQESNYLCWHWTHWTVCPLDQAQIISVAVYALIRWRDTVLFLGQNVFIKMLWPRKSMKKLLWVVHLQKEIAPVELSLQCSAKLHCWISLLPLPNSVQL